jgi:hypothetical protein
VIKGKEYYWIDTVFPHQQMRYDFVFKDDCTEYPVQAYLDSYTSLFVEIQALRRLSFDTEYRRRSSEELNIEIFSSGKLRAYADPNFENTSFVSLGLMIAIDDACQSIVSDTRSFFAHNIGDKINGNAPDVVWNPKISEVIDPLRYHDYSIILEYLSSQNNVNFGLLHKFLSQSKFRMQLADLLSTFALIWISAHEDAHFYLGHVDYFKDALGHSPLDENSFLDTFIINNPKFKNNSTRVASELDADRNACMVLVELVCHREMYDFYPFLNEYFEDFCPDILNEPDSLLREKTTYLFQLVFIAVTIAISISERKTLKKHSIKDDYPSVSSRILSCYFEISERIIDISNIHPDRQLYPLSHKELSFTTLRITKAIEIIFKYIFQMHFILKDSEIEAQNIEQVLNFKLDVRLFDCYYQYLIALEEAKPLLDAVFELNKELNLDFDEIEKRLTSMANGCSNKLEGVGISKHLDLMDFFSDKAKYQRLAVKEFGSFRYKRNLHIPEKITHCLAYEERLARQYDYLSKVIKSINSIKSFDSVDYKGQPTYKFKFFSKLLYYFFFVRYKVEFFLKKPLNTK